MIFLLKRQISSLHYKTLSQFMKHMVYYILLKTFILSIWSHTNNKKYFKLLIYVSKEKRMILIDNGEEFISKDFKRCCKKRH